MITEISGAIAHDHGKQGEVGSLDDMVVSHKARNSVLSTLGPNDSLDLTEAETEVRQRAES